MTTVAVLGATGRQGGSVVDALLADRVNFSFSLEASRDGRVQSTSFEDFLRAHPGARL